jgi:hypothetical protein
MKVPDQDGQKLFLVADRAVRPSVRPWSSFRATNDDPRAIMTNAQDRVVKHTLTLETLSAPVRALGGDKLDAVNFRSGPLHLSARVDRHGRRGGAGGPACWDPMSAYLEAP